HRLNLLSQNPLVLMGQAKKRIVAMTGKRDGFIVDAGTLVDPVTVEQSIGNIADQATVLHGEYDFAVTSFVSVTDQFQDMYFQGPAAIYRFDIQQAENVVEGINSERIQGFDRQGQLNPAMCLDPGHRYGPAIRFAGYNVDDNFRMNGGREDDVADYGVKSYSQSIEADVDLDEAPVSMNSQGDAVAQRIVRVEPDGPFLCNVTSITIAADKVGSPTGDIVLGIYTNVEGI